MKSVRLSEVCEFKPSKRLAKARLSENDPVSFIPMNALGIHQMHLGQHDQRPLSDVIRTYTYFADGDVLLAKITPCFENGKLGVARGLTNGIGFGSSEFMVIRPSERLLPEYLYYFLERPEFRITGAQVMTGAVGHKRVPQEFVESLEIRLPNTVEQRRIVAVLDEAFAAIATATANAEKNLANAKSLFGTVFKQAHLDQKVSEFSVVRVDDVADLISGQHIDAINYNNQGVGIGYLTGPSDFGERNPIVTKWTEFPKRTASRGDILITVKGSGVGSVNMMDADELAISRQLMAVRVNATDPELVYWALETGFEHFQSLASGAAIPGISRADVLNYKIMLPPRAELQEFMNRMRGVRENSQRLVASYSQQLSELKSLKQSLLHSAFTGDLSAT